VFAERVLNAQKNELDRATQAIETPLGHHFYYFAALAGCCKSLAT
jgi:hypothetical protein